MNECIECAVNSAPLKDTTQNRKIPFLLGVILFIIPKCPACFISYYGAMTICGSLAASENMERFADIRPYIALSVSLIVTAFVLLKPNNKLFNKYSIWLSFLGILFISGYIFFNWNFAFYYLSASLFVVSSFLYSTRIQKIISKISDTVILP